MSETHIFASPNGPIAWTHDAASLTVSMAGREHRILWNDLAAAGVALLPLTSATDPNLARHLLIAPGGEAKYLLRIPVPEDDAAADALVATVQERSGDHWLTDLTRTNYRQRFDPNASPLPEWAIQAAILAFVALSALMLFGCLLFAMAREGAWEIVTWQVATGFVLWLVIVAIALALYRRIWFQK